jgi:hypothetical protein
MRVEADLPFTRIAGLLGSWEQRSQGRAAPRKRAERRGEPSRRPQPAVLLFAGDGPPRQSSSLALGFASTRMTGLCLCLLPSAFLLLLLPSAFLLLTSALFPLPSSHFVCYYDFCPVRLRLLLSLSSRCITSFYILWLRFFRFIC